MAREPQGPDAEHAGRVRPDLGRRSLPARTACSADSKGDNPGPASLLVILAIPAEPAAAATLLTVDSSADRIDANIGDGNCRTTANTCTLRAAIQAANAVIGHDSINVGQGVYELESPAINDDTAATGDFDITDTVTIFGVSAEHTIVGGGVPPEGLREAQRGMDRLFEIHPNAGRVNSARLAPGMLAVSVDLPGRANPAGMKP